MPKQMSPLKRRVSFAAWKDDWSEIEKMAKTRRSTPTEILREAINFYLDANHNATIKTPIEQLREQVTKKKP